MNEDELLEEEETSDNSLEESEEETEEKESNKIELDFGMDPVERLTKEIEFTQDANKKAMGNFLLEEFKKDETIKADYRDKKITLDKIYQFIVNEAQKRAKAQKNSTCVVMSDAEVFGMIVHYVHDGASAASKDTTYTLTREEKKNLEEEAKKQYLAEQKAKLAEEEAKKAEKEAAAKAKALEKEKKEREESGQLSLFDLGDEND